MSARRIVRHPTRRRRQALGASTISYHHGCLVRVFGLGVFLRGPSGSGKSLAAFELIRLGHQLIADDMVKIQKMSSDLIGQATPPLAGFLHIHGIGLIDVSKTCGEKSLLVSSSIDLIIECLESKDTRTYNQRTGPPKALLAGVKLPIYQMTSGTTAAFIEAAVLKKKATLVAQKKN